MRIYSGFTANTPSNLLLGPGAVYVDYGEVTERLLGATDGGNSFNLGVTYRDIEVDKPFGIVKGLRLTDDIQPTITTNLKEVSLENLQAIFPGMKAGTPDTTHTPLTLGMMDDTHYLTNVALVGTIAGKDDPVVIVLKNAIANVDGEISLNQDDEATMTVTFTGTFAAADVEAYMAGTKELEEISPVEIRFPLA